VCVIRTLFIFIQQISSKVSPILIEIGKNKTFVFFRQEKSKGPYWQERPYPLPSIRHTARKVIIIK
jgi:hypothetical protein